METKKFKKNEKKAISLAFSIMILAIVLIASVAVYLIFPTPQQTTLPYSQVSGELKRFSSADELIKAFSDSQKKYYGRGKAELLTIGTIAGVAAPSEAASAEYSTTNIQVAGVDEADVVKNDGNYIYTISGEKIFIIKAYPAEDAEILTEIKTENFYPSELFIDKDRLLIFGNADYQLAVDTGEAVKESFVESYYPYYSSFISVKIYDISDRKNPELLKTYDFEGSYLTSRKIDNYAYFVINSYPRYYTIEKESNESIIPLYRESKSGEGEFKKIAEVSEIGYFEPIYAESFMTLVSIDVQNPDNIKKETITASGENVYSSLENLYITQTVWPYYPVMREINGTKIEETTTIHKFSLARGEIKFISSGEIPGHVLNQFSMDEYKENFRIATTLGEVWQGDSRNNIYVLDSGMSIIGKLEDLAPGEKIYSARFINERAYLVTFKKIDPLFVISLENPNEPKVLGKLKIPGYSDYLHPYDENHIIGIGKEAIDAEQRADFAWYQGMKIAIFDVSDVENPIEMFKTNIGDRGTDSEVLQNHKAFLFDKKRELLVLPILLAEIKGEKTSANQYGDYVYQGAYVYKINLEDGFVLQGRITHYEDNESFIKSGYYFYGNRNVKRALYIDNVLYTISNEMIKMNNLENLNEINKLELPHEEEQPAYKIL